MEKPSVNSSGSAGPAGPPGQRAGRSAPSVASPEGASISPAGNPLAAGPGQLARPGASPPAPPVQHHRLHLHVFLTHFPISLFGVAFGFQVLHLFAFPTCFELATNVALIGGTIMLAPTILTGWWSWKNWYRGARGLIFRRKTSISLAMLAVCFPLTTWRTVYLSAFEDAPYSPWHWIYFAGNGLLILGALAEGFYGSRLSHR
jgi:uncharacterized membrane protein